MRSPDLEEAVAGSNSADMAAPAILSYERRQDLTSWVRRILELGTLASIDLMGPDSRRIVRIGLQGVLPRIDSRHDTASLAYLSDRFRKTTEAAVTKILVENEDQEIAARTVDWALDAPIPRRRTVLVLSPSRILPCLAHLASGEIGSQGTGPGFSYVADLFGVLPSGIRLPAWTTLLTAGTRSRMEFGCDAFAESSEAKIKVPGNGEQRRALLLPGLAGVIQALLRSESKGSSWLRVYPPAGFVGLTTNSRPKDVDRLAAHSLLGLQLLDQTGKTLAVCSKSLPKEEPRPRSSLRRRFCPQRKVGEHMPEYAGDIKVKEPYLLPEPPETPPHVLIPTNFAGREVPRMETEIGDIEEITADSTEELCRKAGIQIRGTFEDIDGNPVDVVMPVQGADDFTPDGLTRHPAILAGYVASETCDQIVKYTSAREKSRLTDEEVQFLKEVLAQLEEAIEGES